MKSPIEQFEVVPLINLEIYESKIDITITNLFLANAAILIFIIVLTYYITPKSDQTSCENIVFFIPNRWQLLIEYLIMTISQLVADNLGNNSEAQEFLPFIFSLFNIILLTNLLGLLPYSFTVTSHLIITFFSNWDSTMNLIFNINLKELSLVPEFFLAFTAVIIISHCSLIAYNKRYNSVLIQFSITSLCILILFLTFILYFHVSSHTVKHLSFEFSFLSDSLGFLSKIITILSSLICMYLLQDYIIDYRINSTEYELIMLYAILGLTMLITANDFGTIFLALELQSLSLYILAGFKKNSVYSIESGLKYFILGALSTAYFLLGWSLLYGISGLFVLTGFHFFLFNSFSDVSIEAEINDTDYKTHTEKNRKNFVGEIVRILNLRIEEEENEEDKWQLMSGPVVSLVERSIIPSRRTYRYREIVEKRSYCPYSFLDCYCCDDCNAQTPAENDQSVSDEKEVFQMYDSKKSELLDYRDYAAIPCELCRNIIREHGITNEDEIREKEYIRSRTQKLDNTPPSYGTKDKERCWACRKVLEIYEEEMKKVDRKQKIKLKKMVDIYGGDSKKFNDYFTQRNIPQLISEELKNDILVKSYFKMCKIANLEGYIIPICEHVIKRFRKAYEIEGIRKHVFKRKLFKSCENLKTNGKTCKVCQALSERFAFSENDQNETRNNKNEIEIKTKKISYNKKSDELKLTKYAVTLILISFFFKLAVAPFHLWSLDIYEGSLTSSTIFFAVVTKFSVIVIFIKICYYGFYSLLKSSLYQSIIIAAASSILVGSVAGLTERKLKSLLAYSSINNIGYILLSLTIGTLNGVKTTLFYLIIYLSSSLATWSGLISIQLKKNRYIKKQNKEFSDIVMLIKTNPVLTLTLQIALFSTAGLPPFIGFLTKMNVFLASIESHMFLVSLITILLSIISTFYYLRLIKITCFEKMLVGKLYKPIKIKQSTVNTIFSFFLPYQFLKPWFSIFFSYRVVIC